MRISRRSFVYRKAEKDAFPKQQILLLSSGQRFDALAALSELRELRITFSLDNEVGEEVGFDMSLSLLRLSKLEVLDLHDFPALCRTRVAKSEEVVSKTGHALRLQA